MPKEYLQVNISDLRSVPLSMLLPSWKGQGICSIALVCCLTNIQNEFLDVYVKECKQKYDECRDVFSEKFSYNILLCF